MKVTTDASLLGAYASVEHAKNILDIGAGTGLLSLFAAQRSSADIDAVELDQKAASQARSNFLNSPWSDRLHAVEMDIREFAKQTSLRYDCIITNPPFFTDSTPNQCDRSTLARHNTQLPLTDLISVIKALLSPEGNAWILLPLAESESIIQLASTLALFPQERMQVRNSCNHKPHREILTLGHQLNPVKESLFTLYDEHPYHTPEAVKLFTPYYMKIKVKT